jgi:hypothetical protein
MNLIDLKSHWLDTKESHAHINDLFCQLVDADHNLKTHREFVANGYGFGEKSFWWLWKLICDEQEKGFSFLEIGVYKSGTLSLIKLLRPDATVHGVTPLSSEGGYQEHDYWQCIQDLHEYFGLNPPGIIKGLSNEPWVIQAVKDLGKWDVLYVDGDHSFDGCLNDLKNYAPLIKKGGYLLVDDAGHYMNMPHGYFRGHKEVSDALLAYLTTNLDQWEFIANVVHLMCFKRK